jgi:Ca2+/Na+ antiporter
MEMLDSLPEINHNQFVFGFLLIILIYLVINYGKVSTKLVKTLLLAAIAGMVVFGYKIVREIKSNNASGTEIGAPKESENMSDPEYLVGDPEFNLAKQDNELPTNFDDTSLSKYNNISKDFDVDYLGQDETKSLIPSKQSNEIDNSEVFDNILNQSSMFSPNEAHSRDYYNVEDRAWYSKHFQQPQNITVEGLTIPINERGVNADDSLTRRQITRGEINKKATDGRVRATKNLFQRFFKNEQAESYATEWWGGEGEPDDIRGSAEMDFVQF